MGAARGTVESRYAGSQRAHRTGFRARAAWRGAAPRGAGRRRDRSRGGRGRRRQDAAGAGCRRRRGAQTVWGRAGESVRRRPTARWSPRCGRPAGEPAGTDGLGPLGRIWRCCCPSSGEPAPTSDRATLFEAICAARSRRSPPTRTCWSCSTTFSGPTRRRSSSCRRSRSRSGELPLLRRRRLPLRRPAARPPAAPAAHTSCGATAALRGAHPRPARRRAQTAELLAEHPRRRAVAARSRDAIYDRTQGVPFFVEELARALLRTDALAPGRAGSSSPATDVPLPDTHPRRRARRRTPALSPTARAAADAAAVAGEVFDLELVAALSSAAGLDGAGRPRDRGRGRRPAAAPSGMR